EAGRRHKLRQPLPARKFPGAANVRRRIRRHAEPSTRRRARAARPVGHHGPSAHLAPRPLSARHRHPVEGDAGSRSCTDEQMKAKGKRQKASRYAEGKRQRAKGKSAGALRAKRFPLLIFALCLLPFAFSLPLLATTLPAVQPSKVSVDAARLAFIDAAVNDAIAASMNASRATSTETFEGCTAGSVVASKGREKAKGKRQRAKIKSGNLFARSAPALLPFALCLLPSA